MGQFNLVGDWYVPTIDVESFPAVMNQVNDLEAMLAFTTQQRTVIQAGGNIGIWPVRLAKYFTRVVTVEPDETNFEALCMNTDARRLPVERLLAAFGSKEGSCHVDRVQPKTIRALQITHATNGDIPVIRIDSLGITNVDFLQLAVKGSEHDAVLGAKETIKKFQPVIVLELKGLGERYGYLNADTEELLSSWGYDVAARIHRDVIFVPSRKGITAC